MDKSRLLWRAFTPSLPRQQQPTAWICTSCLRRKQPTRKPFPLQHPHQQARRHQSTQPPNPADEPGFTSPLDNPPNLIRSGRKHNTVGLLFLATIPVTAFVLGCWQVQRLGWKTDLLARFEDRLVRDPLPLPPQIDPDAIHDFDYRRVYARGVFRHDQEMLIGPRMHDGNDGYLVITPLDRSTTLPSSIKGNSTVLVNRGWISKDKAPKHLRPEGLPTGEVVVEGLMREPWKKNMFTPENKPEEGAWYFPDVYEMAAHTGSQAVWVEETMKPDLLASYERESKGIPIGRPPEVNLRNNHAQYIFTWFSLSAATSLMLWMVIKRPSTNPRARIRRNTGW